VSGALDVAISLGSTHFFLKTKLKVEKNGPFGFHTALRFKTKELLRSDVDKLTNKMTTRYNPLVHAHFY